MNVFELNDYQFKTSRHHYGSTYVNPIVTKNQKSIMYTQKPKRNESNHTTEKIIRPQGRNKEYKQSTKLQMTNYKKQTTKTTKNK